MSKQAYQFANTRPASGVALVESITRAFLKQARGHYVSDQAAIAAIARRAHVSPAAIRRFVQPSRRPKTVSLELWQRIRAAYADFLRSQLRALEHDIARIETLDPADGALRNLVDEAEALAQRIKAAI